jgi:hypothetical protein
MRIVYSWGPLEVLVEAEGNALAYAVILLARDFSSTPMFIDTRWGADHAAKIALDTYLRASLDPKGFMASERLDATHMRKPDALEHVEWVHRVIDESSGYGALFEEALFESKKIIPVDVSREVQLYFELVDFGYEAAIAGLIGQGYSREEAEDEFHRQSTLDSINRWKLVPSLRSARGGRGKV